MKHLKNILTLKEKQQIQSEAVNMFREKSVIDKYKQANQLFNNTRKVLGLLSIAGGTATIYYNVSNNTIHPYLTFIFALGVLILIEVIKHKTGVISFVALLKNELDMLSIGGILVMLLSSLFSFQLSIQGVKLLHKNYDNTIVDTKQYFKSQKDSVISVYTALIQAKQNDLTGYKSSVSYKGKINIHNKTNRNVIDTYTNAINLLEAQKIGVLKAIEEVERKELINSEKEYSFNSEFWYFLSIGNELLILLLIFLDVYFNYKVSLEVNALKDSVGILQEEETFSLLRDIQQLRAKDKTLALPVAENKIGFEVQEKKDMYKTDYIKKYPDVVKLYEKGLSRHQIEKEVKCSYMTINHVINYYDMINNGKPQAQKDRLGL